jgi:hypothetical protein
MDSANKKLSLLLLIVLGTVCGVYPFVNGFRRSQVEAVDKGLGGAFTESDKLPPGFGRGEDALRRLKAINTEHAPADLRQAVFDYTAAYERMLISLKAGRDPSAESKPMSETRARIIEIEHRYQNNWLADLCPIVTAACIWGIVWIQRRTKRRGEQLPEATPKQRKSRTRLIVAIIVLTTLAGPFWLPYQGIHLSFWTLVCTSVSSCIFALVAFWLGLRLRRKS